MKRVWKCDFCSRTDVLSEKIKEHELECSFNPERKTCYTCKYHGDDGYYGESCTFCKTGLDVENGEHKGKCLGWETDNPILIRKLKLKKILKNVQNK